MQAHATENPLGFWQPGGSPLHYAPAEVALAAERFREATVLVQAGAGGAIGVGVGGRLARRQERGAYPVMAVLPPLYPEWLGDRAFTEAHGLRFPYVAGEMASGIASPAMVVAMAGAGMLGFLGTAGLSLDQLERDLAAVRVALGPGAAAWGANLIHSPNDPESEAQVVALYLRHGVRRVSASAFLAPTLSVVRYACTGLHRDASGRIVRPHQLFAKVSRPEVARPFLSPAPAELLQALVSAGSLRPEEAELARAIPLVEDLTVEADSGGHTDSRPLPALFPAMLALSHELARRHGFARPARLGAAGGLATPEAIAAAFTMGAAYVMTGSINQSAVEAATSHEAKRMLAEADLADMAIAPAGDMFELGAKVQVLKRGTMFAPRATRLYELYSTHDSLEALSPSDRARLEQIFQASIEAVWEETRGFFQANQPQELVRAARDPKHRMALVFRWYLGKSSRWAIAGDPDRRADYQIWCGPAMGSFNRWVSGSFLEPLENRQVAQIALNLLEGAAAVTRAQQLRSLGVPIPPGAFHFRPRPLR